MAVPASHHLSPQFLQPPKLHLECFVHSSLCFPRFHCTASDVYSIYSMKPAFVVSHFVTARLIGLFSILLAATQLNLHVATSSATNHPPHAHKHFAPFFDSVFLLPTCICFFFSHPNFAGQCIQPVHRRCYPARCMRTRSVDHELDWTASRKI